MKMRKWLAKFVTVLLVMGLMPVTPGMTMTRADTAVTIAVNSNGIPTQASGEGWTYENNMLTLSKGYTFTIANIGLCSCKVTNNGTISDGTFTNNVTNSGTISGGTFHDSVTNNSGGTISDGNFSTSVINDGTISGGSFRDVTNDGTISGGDFKWALTNEIGGTISGGTFAGKVTNNNGTIVTSSNVIFMIAYSLNNLSASPDIVTNTANQVITLTAETGYTLPESVTVTMNEKTANSGQQYTYDRETGTITIDYTNPALDGYRGGLSVSASGLPTYTVVFDPNGGYGFTQQEVFASGEEKALSKNGCWKLYLAFKNWNRKPDGTGNAYEDGATVKDLSTTAGDYVYLYAQWMQGTGGIAVDRSNLVFADTVEGEDPPAAITLYVTNTGNIGLDHRATGAPDFTADLANGEGIKPANSRPISIRPKSGLAPGDYNESLTIFDNNGAVTPVTISLSYTVLSKDDTLNLVDTKTGDSLNANRNAIYASPADATESDAEIEYCDMSVGTDTASPSDARASQHFTLGKSQKLKFFTWDGVTYTKWKVFCTKDTTTCKYIYVMHNPAYEILFDGNGGTLDTASGKTDEDGYLTSLPTASRSGFVFAGWYTDKTGGTQVSKSTKFTAPAKLYAHWTSSDGDSDGGTSYTGLSGKWLQDSIGWWYRNADGTWPANAWKEINGKWYHFDRSGYMQTGWILDNGKWYYLDPDTGAMVTGLLKAPDGYWYYFRSDGSMAVGDVTVDGEQRHFNDQIPPEPTYVSDPEKGTWVPNGNTDLPYGAGKE